MRDGNFVVLFADDEPEYVRIAIQNLTRIFRSGTSDIPALSIEFVPAHTVDDASEMLFRELFDLVIIDLRMPATDYPERGGLALLRDVKRIDASRPIIVFTGDESQSAAAASYAGGAHRVLVKETSYGPLAAAIASLLLEFQGRPNPSGNPFRISPGDDPLVSKGRDDAKEFFLTRLTQAQGPQHALEHFLVIGGWGSGKSCVMREFRRQCQERRIPVVLASIEALSADATPAESALALLYSIALSLSVKNALKRKVQKFLEELQSVGLFGFTVSKTSKASPSAVEVLSRGFSRIWADIAAEQGIWVLLIDDTDNVAEQDTMLVTLRQVIASEILAGRRILCGLSYSRIGWNDLSRTKSYQGVARFFEQVHYLKPLTRIQSEEVVVETLQGSGVTFANEVVRRMVSMSSGNPFALQLLGYNLYDQQDQSTVRAAAWSIAKSNARLAYNRTFLASLWPRLSLLERAMLVAIARTKPRASIEDIRASIAGEGLTLPTTEVEDLTRRLVDIALIRPSRSNAFSLADSMLEDLLRSPFRDLID